MKIKFRSVYIFKSNGMVSHFNFWGFISGEDNQLFTPPDSIPNTQRIDAQYVGIEDKNGREIYEGDVVNLHIFTQELGKGLGVSEGEREFIGEIAIQPLGVWIQGKTGDDSGYLLWYDGLHEESLEVIGNIHENPELLK